jgi:hypothetical protein
MDCSDYAPGPIKVLSVNVNPSNVLSTGVVPKP